MIRIGVISLQSNGAVAQLEISTLSCPVVEVHVEVQGLGMVLEALACSVLSSMTASEGSLPKAFPLFKGLLTATDVA